MQGSKDSNAMESRGSSTREREDLLEVGVTEASNISFFSAAMSTGPVDMMSTRVARQTDKDNRESLHIHGVRRCDIVWNKLRNGSIIQSQRRKRACQYLAVDCDPCTFQIWQVRAGDVVLLALATGDFVQGHTGVP
mmetsp:Transcript_111496/g.326119  ORF Transcript_111496/g.326119 Transcript_111496/m.326119 type:complete len:136 (+) Transcript_111496:114-521(+)